VVIRGCTMKDGHGGVVLGSECTGGIRNVFVENCTMDSPELDRALRFKNNAVMATQFSDIVAAFLNNGRDLLGLIDTIVPMAKGEKVPDQLPSVKLFVLCKTKDELAADYCATLEQNLDHPNLFAEAIDDKSQSLNKKIREQETDFVLLVDKNAMPTAGTIEELLLAAAREPESAIIIPKMLYPDDTLKPTIYEVNRKHEFHPFGATLTRFDKAISFSREINLAELTCALIHRNSFLEVHGFEENYTPLYRAFDFCLKISSIHKKVIFCTDAEVYCPIENDTAKLTVADLERDHWRLTQNFRDHPIFKRTTTA